MGMFDLNNPADFAALTSALGSAAGAAGSTDWQITESSFRNVKFHIFSSQTPGRYQIAMPKVTDRGGRRNVLYEFPFKSGQTTGDLGSKGKRWEFDVVFFGDDYLDAANKFIAALDQPTPAVLVHPVMGNFTAKGDDWETTHESVEQKTLTMHVIFVEHSYTVGQTPAKKQNAAGSISVFKAAVINAVKVFQGIDSALTTIQANKAFAQSFINGISQEIDTYKTDFLTVLSSIYLTFSPAGTVTAASDLPGVLPVNLGGASTGSGTVQSSSYPVVDQSQTPFAEVTSSTGTTTPVAVAAIQAQNQVNALRAQAESIITGLNSAASFGVAGVGSITFYAEVLTFKQSAIALQTALEQGVASSSAQISFFTVPMLMTIREVAFAVGLTPDDSDQIATLNPQLQSVNYIPQGTVLQVPTVAA